ncbi:hypothetical protein AZH11_15520 [Pseudomonas simiae]|nr:hypothetical protein AZH11_15520 [Pseudomonas simiae]
MVEVRNKSGSVVRNEELLMIKMPGINNLFSTVNSHTDNDWVYTNLDKWEEEPEKAIFYLISEDEIDDLEDDDKTVENSAGELIPKSLEKENVETWLDVQTLQAIFEVIQKKVKAPDSDILIQAINHYREYDDFMEA